MVLGGLWHGAAWTFVLWGVYHGLLLIAYRAAERSRGSRRWLLGPSPLARVTSLGRDVPPHLLRLADLPGRASASRSGD